MKNDTIKYLFLGMGMQALILSGLMFFRLIVVSPEQQFFTGIFFFFIASMTTNEERKTGWVASYKNSHYFGRTKKDAYNRCFKYHGGL